MFVIFGLPQPLFCPAPVHVPFYTLPPLQGVPYLPVPFEIPSAPPPISLPEKEKKGILKNICEICKREFSRPNHLKTHILSHTKAKPFGCSICGKSYSQEYKLKAHMKIHREGYSPITCPHPGCNKVLATSSGLKVHMRIHTNERPFECVYPGCGKTFKTIGNLGDHKKVHTCNEFYYCQACDAKFKRPVALKTHQMGHTGERPFVCPIEGCGRSFIQKGNLKTHLKTHTKNMQEDSKGENATNKETDNLKNSDGEKVRSTKSESCEDLKAVGDYEKIPYSPTITKNMEDSCKICTGKLQNNIGKCEQGVEFHSEGKMMEKSKENKGK